jgi:CysZ protein
MPPLSVNDGFKAFGGGIAFIVGVPSVWPYAVVPAVMMLVVVLAFGSLGVWGAVQLTSAVVGETSSFWGQLLSWVLTAVLTVTALLCAVLAALVLAQPLSGFALERIVRKQEQALTGQLAPAPSFIAAFLGSMKIALVTLAVGGSALATLLIIDLVFPPAVVVTFPLKVLLTSWLLAWDFLDYPLGLRGFGLRARLRWVGRNFGAFTAFGLMWGVLVIVPGIVLLLLPMGVAGATCLVIAAEGRGPMPNDPDFPGDNAQETG